MKKVFIPLVFALLLSACNQPKTLTYDVTFTTDNPDRMNDLSLATRHVIERRLERFDAHLIDYDVAHNTETKETEIEVQVDNADAAQFLNEKLTEPFSFEIRYLADEEQEGDIYVENVGYFRPTDIVKEDIDWVLGQALDGPQQSGRVVIGFTDVGVEKMQNIFDNQDGSTIGIFVRNMLTASLKIEEGTIERTIAIDGVPSGDLAKVFADDVNVGIHMTFTPKN